MKGDTMTAMTKAQKREANYAKFLANPKNQAYAKQPLALIEKPLKYIKSKLITRDSEGKVNVPEVVYFAQNCAENGKGTFVRQLAMHVHNGVVTA